MLDIFIVTIKLGYECLVSIARALMGLVFVAVIFIAPFMVAGAIWKIMCVIFRFNFDWFSPIAIVICAGCLILTAEGGE